MTGETKDVEFFVNDSVYVQVVSLALQELSDQIPAKGRSVAVRQHEGVQEHAAAVLQEMAAPQTLEVHVTVDDVVLKE